MTKKIFTKNGDHATPTIELEPTKEIPLGFDWNNLNEELGKISFEITEIDQYAKNIYNKFNPEKQRDLDDVFKNFLNNEEGIKKIKDIETSVALDETEKTRQKYAELLTQIENLKEKAEQVKNLYEAIIVSSQKLPEDLEQLSREKKKNLHTTYRYATPEENTKVQSKIEESMQHALCKTFKVLNKNEFPVALLASNVLVNLIETSKIPDDGDQEACLPDLIEDMVAFKEMEKKGEISELKIFPVTNLDGEKNACFEVRYFVIGKDKKDRKPMSIFYHNPKDEKETLVDNSIVSAGYKDNELTIYELLDENGNVVQVPFASKEATEYLYTYNFLLELPILDFKNYAEGLEKYPWITPKALHRMNNIIQLNDSDFTKIVNNLRGFVRGQKNETLKSKFHESIGKLISLKRAYKKEGIRISDKKNDTESIGLIEYFSAEKKIDHNDPEKVVSAFTKEMKIEMSRAHEAVGNAKTIFDECVAKLDLIENSEKSQIIEGYIEKLAQLSEPICKSYNKYYDYLHRINYEDSKDFTLFVATKMLEEDFLWPAVSRIWSYEDKLKEKIEN